MGASMDNWVGIPLTTFLESYGSQPTMDIYIDAGGGGETMDAVIDEVRTIMRTRRHLAPGTPDSFSVDSSATFGDMLGKIVNNFGAVVVAIAGISLVVGGIVIMNIMLVSVTERTREIGVRKAIGARKGDILMQFTLEAITLTAIGGILGVLLGALITFAIRSVWDALPATMSLFWASFGFLSAAAEGLVFGIYPAWKAANLDPIESLRYE
jgi:putative ABC transport system permease protein